MGSVTLPVLKQCAPSGRHHTDPTGKAPDYGD
jgi:hypothetical protein